MDSKITELYKKLYSEDRPLPKKRLTSIYIEQVEGKGGEEFSIYSKSPESQSYDHLGDIEATDLPKVKKLVSVSRGKNEVAPYLQSKNYSPERFKNPRSFDALVELLSTETWLNFIKTSDKPDIQRHKSGNLGDVAATYGVDTTSVRQLADFQSVDASGSNIGPGEILLSVLFEDVVNSTSGGDLLNTSTNSKIEVKGQQGRFGQQSGRSSQGVSFDGLNSQLKNKINGVEQNTSVPLALGVFHGEYKKEGKENLFKNQVIEFLSTFYPKADFESIIKSPALFGNKNTGRKVLEKLYLSNYATKYNLQEILFLDKEALDYALFTPEEALSNGGYIDSGKLQVGALRFNNLYPSVIFNF